MLNLLSTEMNHKINVLNYLENYNDNLVPQWQLEELTGLSSFKMSNLIDELIYDLSDYPESAIILDKKKVYTIKGITTEIINHLRLTFIQESLYFQIYMFYFRGGNNLNLFIKELGVSTAFAYNIIKKINEQLVPYDLKITNQSLDGDEKRIRLITFEMLSFYFKGSGFVHEEDTISKFENQLFPFIKFLNIELTPTSTFQWRLFIEQFYYRNALGKHVTPTYLLMGEADEQPTELKRLFSLMKPVFKNTFKDITDEQFENEFYYFIEFLVAENLVHDQTIIQPTCFPEVVHDKTEHLVSTIFEKKQDVAVEPQIITQLKVELYPIFFKYHYFSYKSDSFHATDHLGIFKNLYPDASDIIELFFAEENIDITRPVNIQLYYDCMFRVINFVPHAVLESPLYLCVDFSRGPVYSEHIKNNIRSFQSLHIIFEQTITDKTMLYISDFSTYEYQIPQIIWKAPPTINDWNVLGTTLVQLKRSIS